MGFSHCPTCLSLDKCWFTEDNLPNNPLHPRCHCTTEELPGSYVLSRMTAMCPPPKFTGYIFNPNNKRAKAKANFLHIFGYGEEDIEYLIAALEKQALEKYKAGKYRLKTLKEQGQIINIFISIPKRTEPGMLIFDSGWLVHPNGFIHCTTPVIPKKEEE